MRLEFDETKRLKTLEERGLDFLDAPKLLEDLHIIQQDD